MSMREPPEARGPRRLSRLPRPKDDPVPRDHPASYATSDGGLIPRKSSGRDIRPTTHVQLCSWNSVLKYSKNFLK
jgi:hypothetical protein